ncbi:SAM-dependent methyltransferase [Actinoplanes sp. NPDC020271]|uniref:SAM-dependent methyltransferase n=1 Tax=Actinoplanes sp. NPDC020271 TaxID=3363896 RepID=UPI00378A8179
MTVSPAPVSGLVTTGSYTAGNVPSRSRRGQPSSAGRYDYLLGRNDNTAADQASAAAITDFLPTAALAARANRRFVWNAASDLAGAGIGQFIDIGTGIPALPDISGPHIHNCVHWKNHHAPVVYVDNDPHVVDLARSRLINQPGRGQITVLHGDLRDPDDILTRAVEQGGLDPRRPIGILLTAVLHYLPDDDRPYERLRELVATLPARSALVISHLSLDLLPTGLHSQVPDIIAASGIPAFPRPLAEISRFFDGLKLTTPGIIAVHRYRSRPYERSRFELLPDTAVGLYCGIGRKPD